MNQDTSLLENNEQFILNKIHTTAANPHAAEIHPKRTKNKKNKKKKSKLPDSNGSDVVRNLSNDVFNTTQQSLNTSNLSADSSYIEAKDAGSELSTTLDEFDKSSVTNSTPISFNSMSNIINASESSILTTEDNFNENYVLEQSEIESNSSFNNNLEEPLNLSINQNNKYVCIPNYGISFNIPKIYDVLCNYDGVPLDAVPLGKKENFSYIVKNQRTHCPGDEKRVFWDDCGKWGYSGSHTIFYKFVDGKPYRSGPEDSNKHFALNTYTRKASADINYKRNIYWITDLNCITPKQEYLVLWEYTGFQPKSISMHGNVKRDNREFKRTHPDTVAEMKIKLKTCTPYETYHAINSSQPEHKRVRNLPQVRNTKSRMKRGEIGNQHCANVSDSFKIIIGMASRQHESDYKIKAAVYEGKPYVIYYHEDAMNNLRNIVNADCKHAPILGIDKTYNVSNYYLTLTAFQSPYIVRSQEKNIHPIFLGPMMIHQKEDYLVFMEFLTHIKQFLFTNNTKVKNFQPLKICTDEEAPLTLAITKSFLNHEVTHILCAKHLEENVERQAKKKGVKDVKIVIKEIFKQGGLVESKSERDFNKKVAQLKQKYKEECPKFAEYFVNVKNRIKKGICRPVWQKSCVLGFKNNSCESMNHIVKHVLNWKKVLPHKLIIETLEMSKNQWKEVKAALFDEGNFQLTECAKKFKYSWNAWTEKSQEDQDKIYNKFIKHYCKKDHSTQYVTSTDGTITLQKPPNRARKPNQKGRPSCNRTVTW